MNKLNYLILFPLFVLMGTKQLEANPPDWEPPNNLQYNMQVVAFLELPDQSYSQNGDDLIAAFVGDECRGLASPLVNAEGRVFLTIGSNTNSGEQLHFKAYLAETGQIADLAESFEFEDQLGVGDFNAPFIFTIDLLYPPAVYTIQAASGPNGNVDPSGAIEIVHGNNQLFEFFPDKGYEVSEVLVNGELIGSPSTYEFENVTSDQEIFVSFSLIIGYPELQKEAKNTIFPNPATDHVFIEQGKDWDGAYYRLTDANGSIKLTGFLTTQKQILWLKQLPQGTYLLMVFDKSGQNIGNHILIKAI